MRAFPLSIHGACTISQGVRGVGRPPATSPQTGTSSCPSAASSCTRAQGFEQTDWVQIEQLYGILFEFQPTPVVALNHAVAVSYARHPGEALQLVEALAGPLADYFYYHAVRGHLLERLGRGEDARLAYGAGLGLANSAAEAAQIRIYLDRLR